MEENIEEFPEWEESKYTVFKIYLCATYGTVQQITFDTKKTVKLFVALT
jgi:hypothetical protein